MTLALEAPVTGIEITIGHVADWIAARTEPDDRVVPIHMDALRASYDLWCAWERRRPLLNAIFRGEILDRWEIKKATDSNMITGIRLKARS